MDSSSWKAYGKIDPDLEALLPHLPPAKNLGDYPDVPTLRSAVTEGVAQMVKAGIITPPDLSSVKKDIQIPGRDGRSIRAVHYQSQSTDNGPVIVLFFGGGFVFGWPETFEKGIPGMLELGFVVVAVDYRLAPENPFPAAVHDALDSVKWVAENASQLGADPTKGFIVGGASAGANLASVVSHEAVDSKLSPPITGVWLCIPLLVLPDAVPEKYKEHYNSYAEFSEGMILDKKALDVFTDAYKPDVTSSLVNPLAWPTGHQGQPPTFIQVCGMDPLRDEALIYEYALRKEYGVPTKLQVYSGLPHGGMEFLPMLPGSKETPAHIKAGLQWLLQQK